MVCCYLGDYFQVLKQIRKIMWRDVAPEIGPGHDLPNNGFVHSGELCKGMAQDLIGFAITVTAVG